MADAVSKLYAEIGFKVNDEELKKAEKVIKGLAATLSQINKNAKEAAKEYGIFSKQRSKQALDDEKLATQQEKTQNQRSKRVIESEKFKHKQLMDYAKFAMQVEKYNNQEKEKEDQKKLYGTQKTLKAMKSIYDSTYSGISKTLGATGRVFQRILGQSVGDAMMNALSTSIPMRDALMQTGLDFQQVQGVARRFANIGSGMSYEGIMGDLRNLQQNLVNISLGQGELAPYKLLGVAAGRGDLFGTIRELGNAIKDLDNPMALNLIRRTGLSDEWLSYFRFQERKGGISTSLSDESLGQLIESQTAIRQLQFAFQETAKHLTAALNPAITSTTDALTQAFEGVISAFNSRRKEINSAFKELGDSLVELVKGINWEEFPKMVKSVVNGFIEGLSKFKAIIDKIAGWLNIGDELPPPEKGESFTEYNKRVNSKKETQNPLQPSPYESHGAIYNSLIKGSGTDLLKSLTISPTITNNVTTIPENTEAVAKGLNESSLQWSPLKEKTYSNEVLAAYRSPVGGTQSADWSN